MRSCGARVIFKQYFFAIICYLAYPIHETLYHELSRSDYRIAMRLSAVSDLYKEKPTKISLTAYTARDNGRGDGTRTHGLFVPNEALYQTEPHLGSLSMTDNPNIITHKNRFVKCEFEILKKYPEGCAVIYYIV